MNDVPGDTTSSDPARPPRFSFIILTFNSARYVQTCLESIESSVQALGTTAEVFIMDNGSVDETLSIIEAFEFSDAIRLELIRFATNTGTTYSRNQGLARSTGEFVVVMDSDGYINPAALDGLAAHLSAHPECGMAVPRLTYPDGRYQLSVDEFPSVVRKAQRFFFLKQIEEKLKISEDTQVVDYAISACWVMPRAVVEKVGMLDERIFYAPEDVDYCIRVWKAGYQIHFVPALSMVHDAQEISRAKGFRVNWFTLSHIKGLAYLYLKHRFLFSGRKFRKYAR